MKISIQWQDQFGHWKHYQMMHHLPGAYRTAKQRATRTEKRHRLVDEDGDYLIWWNPRRQGDRENAERYIQTRTIAIIEINGGGQCV